MMPVPGPARSVGAVGGEHDGVVARQFGVRRRFGPLPVERHTFVIGTDRAAAHSHG
jgi:hypothetical protein